MFVEAQRGQRGEQTRVLHLCASAQERKEREKTSREQKTTRKRKKEKLVGRELGARVDPDRGVFFFFVLAPRGL